MNRRLLCAAFASVFSLLLTLGDRMAYEPIQFTPPAARSIEDRIIVASIAAGLPPSIALDRAWRESKFRPGLISPTGDHGVMQLNERWFPGAASMSLEENIATGVYELAKYWQCYGDARLVHLAYTHGPAVAGRCKGARG